MNRNDRAVLRYLTFLIIISVGVFGLALLLWPARGHAQQIACDQQASTLLTPAGTKLQVVPAPGVGTANIYVCGYVISSAGTSTVTFQAGTGTNCGTTSAAIGPTVIVTAGISFAEDTPTYRGFLVGNPNELCATATTTAANITVYYHTQ
jgi:hypothetical protein